MCLGRSQTVAIIIGPLFWAMLLCLKRIVMSRTASVDMTSEWVLKWCQKSVKNSLLDDDFYVKVK